MYCRYECKNEYFLLYNVEEDSWEEENTLETECQITKNWTMTEDELNTYLCKSKLIKNNTTK